MGKYDDLLAYGSKGSDDYADLSAYGEAPKATVSIPGLSSPDAGPSARRAAAGMSPGPRNLTDEEAGVDSTVIRAPVTKGFGPFPTMVPPSHMDQARRTAAMTPEERRAARAESDANAAFMVSMIPAAGLGRIAGGLTGELGARVLPEAAAPVARIGANAIEGGVANKVMGGDFKTGAALGGGFGAVPEAIDIVAKGAPARVAARIERNLGENARKKTADKITAVAKRGDLNEVLDRNPELRRPLAIQAKEKPAAALKAVQETKSAANEARDADFERMQEHFADKPPSSQASISGILDDYDKLLRQNPADLDRQAVLNRARFEITQLGDRLREAQGLPPAKGDYSGTVLSPKDLRDLEQTIGGRAYEMGTPASVKRKVNAELYKPLARQMNALAEATPGVDAKKFAATGKDIHVLIPVEESLQTQVDRAAQGKTTFGEKVKAGLHGVAHIAGLTGGYAAHGPVGAAVGAALPLVGRAALRGAEGIGRRLDYNLAEGVRAGLPRLRQPFSPALPTAVAGGDRGYAAKVIEHLKAGMPLSAAVDLADGRTELSPSDEKRYQAWKATLPERLQYEGDYDLRGFWKKNPTFSVDDPEQHMTDEFKLPNHPTFSNESRYYNERTKHLGGHWEGDVFIPNDTRYKQRVDESKPIAQGG